MVENLIEFKTFSIELFIHKGDDMTYFSDCSYVHLLILCLGDAKDQFLKELPEDLFETSLMIVRKLCEYF